MAGKVGKRTMIRLMGRKKGQAIVEFALVMVFFLLFMLALIDLGRAFFVSVALENAAAEGALYGAANPSCITQEQCGTEYNVDWRVRHESEGGLFNPADIVIATGFSQTPPQPGSTFAVTVTYPFRPLVPALSSFGAETIPLSRDAVQLVP